MTNARGVIALITVVGILARQEVLWSARYLRVSSNNLSEQLLHIALELLTQVAC